MFAKIVNPDVTPEEVCDSLKGNFPTHQIKNKSTKKIMQIVMEKGMLKLTILRPKKNDTCATWNYILVEDIEPRDS